MSGLVDFAGLYHTGIVVADLESAKSEYAETFGLSWGFAGESDMPVWMPGGARTLHFDFAYSEQGPHRVELVSAIDDSLWSITEPGRVHHLGFWCDDVVTAERRLVEQGATVAARVGVTDEHEPTQIALLQAVNGGIIELVDTALRSQMFPDD